jgi:eukaryotic-like serine/threonine-protein kinase
VSQSYESFGKYILFEKIAMGGMAEIYLARAPGASGVSKLVAIKRILPQFSEQAEFIEMFKDEAKIAINLSHANVVSIFEFGVEKHQFYLAMDFVEGRNLRQILNKMKKSGVTFSIEQVLYIIKEVAAGLDHAHRCIDGKTGKPLNIIHRDMSPQNVMVSFEGEVKVVDFGIAKAETQIENTRAGTLKGKFGYMSPEQAEGQQVDMRTDIFALGIVLWELLANDRLFVSNNEVNTLRKIRDCQIPSLRKINPNIAAELERIVGKALAKDRNLRYQTAGALHRELSRFLNRQYPDFSPQDFSLFIKTLFSSEILDSRQKMVEYARVEVRQEPKALPPANTNHERTVITQTGTQTENTSNDHNELNIPQASTRADRKIPAQAVESTSPQLMVDRKELQQARMSMRGGSGVHQTEGVGVGGSTSYSSGNRSYTETGVSYQQSSGVFPLMILIFIFVFVGGAFYYHSPDQAVAMANKMMIKVGLAKPMVLTENASVGELVIMQKRQYDIAVISSPPGAEILLNNQPQSDVTPATLRIEAGREVTITVRIPGHTGYQSHEEKFKVTENRTIKAVLVDEHKGFLNINVVGAGQIFIDGKLISPTSPALHVAIPADHEVTVASFDPITKAGDQARISVGDNQVKKVTLIPRANGQIPTDASKKQ